MENKFIEKQVLEILKQPPLEYLGASGCVHYVGKNLWIKKNEYLVVSPYDNGFRIECQIYENILNKISSINLPKYYGTFLEDSVLVLENINGKMLYDIYDTLNFSDILKIIIQVLYNIICFEQKGLTHNDLHSQNIIIKELEQPKIFYYKFRNVKLTFMTKYLAKIIDFEEASIYHENIERNFSRSIENTSSKSRDTYIFLSCLYSAGKNGDLKRLLEVKFPDLVGSFPKNSFSYIHSHISPKKYLDTEKVFVDIIKTFRDIFWIDTEIIIPEPNDTLIYGDTENIDIGYPIYNSLKGEYFHIVRELSGFGYNWIENADKLSKILLEKYPDKDSKILEEASLWLTNPIKLREPTDFEKSIDFSPSINIPQKFTPNIDLFWTI
jgi:serine/threonine protein kinase